MVVELLASIIFSILELLKGSLIVAIPVFVFIFIGQKLRKKIAEQTSWSWFTSAIVSSFFIVFSLLLIIYFLPQFSTSFSPIGEVPSIFSGDFAAIITIYVASVLKVLFVALVLTVILMPLEFVGLYFHSVISKKLKKYPGWAKLLATAYASSVFASAIILFLIPEAITGFFYLLYF